MYTVRVLTEDGILEKESTIHSTLDEWESFAAFEQQYRAIGAALDVKYVVQLIEPDGRVTAETWTA